MPTAAAMIVKTPDVCAGMLRSTGHAFPSGAWLIAVD
jgi:hypothetical protein